MRQERRLVLSSAVLLALLVCAASLAAASPGAPAVVSSSWLAERLATEPGSISVIDARQGLRPFLTGHIPGAQLLFTENLRSTAGGVPAALLPLETLQVVIHRLGLRSGVPAVVYSEGSDIDATYVATALRLAGLPNVSVLDGGFRLWSAEGHPETAERTLVMPSTGSLAADKGSLASIDDVRKAIEARSATLLDVRSPEQYAAGHIPGAKNRYWTRDVVAPGQPGAGLFRTEQEIRADLEGMGITAKTPVIVYCNTGHQASEAFFTLKYRLGFPEVRLFNGSWLEWSMTPGTARETSASR
jgi:thiosulfate/3-mercaptopyruvate sulfurtransferase